MKNLFKETVRKENNKYLVEQHKLVLVSYTLELVNVY